MRSSAMLAWLSLATLPLLTGCPSSESPAAAYANDPEAIKRGRGIFTGVCGAYCHGLRPGHRDAPFLFDCDWKHGDRDEDLFRVILEGVPETRMQGFAGKLPDGEEDVWKVIAFLRASSTCR
jgi:mono/diheme cytochrome c family protein